ncbi:MAG: polymerase III subunit beta protein [Candidatus Nomurabacteria bacterium GW2011_GWF2_35_66]|uniref:Beta sliding clamp n=1 Tax=Candidatus Nomurabacteria bacterium GW2011_GWE1_35_16 TaxID=1618761 RepID=A0A0G0BSL0_9BACT|nr:MAG: polymerase III subunit beta protein [Candidatus Nomurabacteria bacterium GW2011_GWF1_34_20]KKP63456.1 MAG: polymerase III subunit beta protein [Candidatus Nomurabacteria bacterium GW2011_GWE2_34_25]KKP66636.1 MAG: polymerase III subunit beta protein [Candidatus Nomurabacteria bacterium GW2011_GWE1_35_16]KKP83744.1 MAG: polymerase III subunit beta protein [Candidatus Nomurabacteria bacterium GW2011_GWF2_35_66]HAE36433.1 DNA polymerase III subunit beta [Candidatus Nomurabacteria bacterium
MKLECSIEKIKNALMTVDRITGKNLTLPVLGSVLWVATGKSLKLRATNLNIGIEMEVPAKIEKEGIVAIRSDILSSLFSVLSGDSIVSFELINDNLSVKTKLNTIILKSISSEDFPTIPLIEGEELNISISKFIEGIKSVYYSASMSEIKPEIGSIYIYPEEDMLVFVATDSFRLAEKKVKIKQKLSFGGILIPFKNTTEIIKVFENMDGDIKITLQKNQISFTTQNIYLTSRIIDGLFPDYKQIIPKRGTTDVTLLKQDFSSSLKISNIFSDKFNQITFNIKPKEKVFEIEAKNTDVGENITLLGGALSGEDVILNFNYKYIIDCFTSISSDSLVLEFNGNNRPMIIKPVGDASFLYLVMPMNR